MFSSAVTRSVVVCAAGSDREARREARKEFRKNIMDRRRASVGRLGKKVSKFVKTEVSETRTILDEHVKFFRPNAKTKKSQNKPNAPVDVEVLDAEFFD